MQMGLADGESLLSDAGFARELPDHAFAEIGNTLRICGTTVQNNPVISQRMTEFNKLFVFPCKFDEKDRRLFSDKNDWNCALAEDCKNGIEFPPWIRYDSSIAESPASGAERAAALPDTAIHGTA